MHNYQAKMNFHNIIIKKKFVDMLSIQSLKKSKKHQVVRCFKITVNRKKKQRFKVVLQFQK